MFDSSYSTLRVDHSKVNVVKLQKKQQKTHTYCPDSIRFDDTVEKDQLNLAPIEVVTDPYFFPQIDQLIWNWRDLNFFYLPWCLNHHKNTMLSHNMINRKTNKHFWTETGSLIFINWFFLMFAQVVVNMKNS